MKFKCLDEVIITTGCGHDDVYIGNRAIIIKELFPSMKKINFI